MEQKYYSHWRPVTKDLPRDHWLGMSPKGIGDLIATKAGYGANSDTSSPIFATALPAIIPIFVRNFPLYDLLRKVPANGISHTWAQQTNFTQTIDPNTIAETGFFNDDANSYIRQTTNIAVFAIRRSASLKATLAGRNQGFDLFDNELQGGFMTIARDVQNETLRYQNAINDTAHTTAAGRYNTADGAYDPNGFNGLRYILHNQVPAENSVIVDTHTPGWTDHRVLNAVRGLTDALWDKGGRVNLLVMDTYAAQQIFADELSFVRINMGTAGTMTDISPNLNVRTITTNQGMLPILVVPGNSMGNWTDGTSTYTDIIAIDTEQLVMPYLGNPEPSLARIPLGVNGQLVEMAVPYAMYGLAALAPSIGLGRVSLLRSTP